MKQRKVLPIYENVEIIDIAAEGKAIAKIDELVVFVPQCVTGDIVDIQITNKRKNFREGYAIRFHKYSEKRVEPKCKHFGVCGGCKWQQLPYSEQLFYKQKQVSDNLKHIGKVELPQISPIVGSEKEFYYRNKLEFTFSNLRWLTSEEVQSGEVIKNPKALGFHVPNMFDKVVDIEHCWLQGGLSNEIRNAVREHSIEYNLDYYNSRTQSGFLRNLIVRTSTTGELMVLVSFHHEEGEENQKLLQMLADKFPSITSLLYVLNPKGNDTINDLEIHTFKGNDHIFEQMEDLRFKIGAKSFYQTNSEQAYKLYCIAREFADLKGDEVVYDLYTGTGTIANFVAHQAKKVVGIEYVPEAIEDARVNSDINNLNNTTFYAGDMKDILTESFFATNGKPDVVITDPPRAGMHNDVVTRLLEAQPEKIVYVSCNPATQARDINLLDIKYKVTRIQPVDMFPHTHHVENVVLLELKS